MKELKKGTSVTPAFLRSLITPLFRKANEVDPSNIRVTSGQIYRTNTQTCDMLGVSSDQYYKSDIMLDQYGGEDLSYLQRYIDEVTKIYEEI